MHLALWPRKSATLRLADEAYGIDKHGRILSAN